jgi:mono/diheme cytochrome c family protein
MRKVLKWLGIILASLVGLVVLAFLGAVGMTTYRLNRTYNISVEKIVIPGDAAAIERGRYLASAQSPCIGCHGPDLAGTFLLDDPAIGQIYSANLTAGKGGKGAAYSDEDWVRALRHGVRPDGKALMVMPSQNIRRLSDADLGALIAYAKSFPPVDKESPQPSLTMMAQVLFAFNMFGKLPAEIIAGQGPRTEAPAQSLTVEYGEHLSYVAGCRDCHGENLAGGNAGGPNGPVTPNLTQGGELLVWTEQDFIKAFRTGETPSGRIMSEDMPIKEYQMVDDDLTALFLYLKSLPAAQRAQ